MRKIYYWLFVRWLAFRWMFQVNLGNEVIYQGKKYTVCNGVRSNSWRLGDLVNGNGGWVRRSDCKLVLSIDNLRHIYNYGVRFYMTNWYEIWCREGVKPWMKGCSIWPRRSN